MAAELSEKWSTFWDIGVFVLNGSFGSHVKVKPRLREARGLRLGGFLRNQDLKEEERDLIFQGLCTSIKSILGLNSTQVGLPWVVGAWIAGLWGCFWAW